MGTSSLKVVMLKMVYLFLMISCLRIESSEAFLSKSILKKIKKVNKGGPFTGVLVSSNFELQPLFDSPTFKINHKLSHLDFGGRRFHIGHIGDRKMIVAMTGKGMINAAITTQVLCALFYVKNVLHYGLAGSANDKLSMGDITIPRHWAHTGFWNWQRYGDGPEDELPFEEKGYFTREYGYLNFADYTNTTVAEGAGGGGGDGGDEEEQEDTPDNFLNNIWYQPEEVFQSDEHGRPESKDTIFWVPIAAKLFELAKKLEGMKLDECINTSTCLPKTPKVVTVKRGSSASIYLDNEAYKNFLSSKFQVSPVDMEGAAIALVSHQHKIPFLAFKALHDTAGESSKEVNHDIYLLLIQNCIKVITHFMVNMHMNDGVTISST